MADDNKTEANRRLNTGLDILKTGSQTGLPREIEAKMRSLRVEMLNLMAHNQSRSSAAPRLNNALNLIKTGSETGLPQEIEAELQKSALKRENWRPMIIRLRP